MISFILPFPQILICLLTGFVLSIIYLGLLWITIRLLAKTRHKGMLLLLSAAIRITIFFTGAILLSQHNPARFLWIVFGFIITRIFFVSRIKLKEKK